MINWDLVQAHKDALMQDAIAAKDLSYSPYSSYRVGAALLLDDGTHVQGANVENASYERTAIVKMKTTPELRTHKIHAVAVSSDGSEPCSPCGVCRQVLREFCVGHTVFFMPNQRWKPQGYQGKAMSLADLQEDNVLVLDMEALLPVSFGPSMLGQEDFST